MTDSVATLQALLTKRLKFVAEISAANADHLRLLQIDGAADIEIASAERAIAESGETTKAKAEIDEARLRKQATLQEITRSETRIGALEAEMDAIDREIETLS